MSFPRKNHIEKIRKMYTQKQFNLIYYPKQNNKICDMDRFEKPLSVSSFSVLFYELRAPRKNINSRITPKTNCLR